MRYYKLTKNNFADALNVGRIYPENFIEWGSKYFDIDYYVNHGYAHFFEEVSAGEYFVQEGIMPEYFAIKMVADNPLWEKYIDWLIQTYKIIGRFDGSAKFYGYIGSTNPNTIFENSIECIINNPIELTLEQWDKIVNKTMEENNKEIIGWKLKEDCKKYLPALDRISIYFTNISTRCSNYFIKVGCTFYKDFKQAGVLELWFTPVYEEKTLRFGGYDVIFEKVTSGVRITCNGETGTFSQVEAIYNFYKGDSAPCKFGSQVVKEVNYPSASWELDFESEEPTSIKIGCTTGTWKEFMAIYEKAKSMLQ